MQTTLEKKDTSMRSIPNLALALMLNLFGVASASEATVVEFTSKDGLAITADVYIADENRKTPFIVLFHQASWSRGEYLEIAPRLNELGFNCMAVDLRSGGPVNGVDNETVARAKANGSGTTYADALPDVVAALRYARVHDAQGLLIAWGSSYSASLVLKVGGDEPDLVNGVLAFAPGEYFTKLGKPSDWITDSAKNIDAPVFITSARSEKEAWFPIFEAIPSKDKTFYLPSSEGNHGSRALWSQFPDSDGYWEAVEAFLSNNFKK